MLNKLYHKLRCVFVCSSMAIISAILAISVRQDIEAAHSNALSYAQRMSTLIIYQLETGLEPFRETIENYTLRSDIFCVVKDAAGKTVYQSDMPFPTSGEYLQEALEDPPFAVVSTEREQQQAVTEQNGPLWIAGQENDRYWGIPALVVSMDRTVYRLSLFYRVETDREIVGRHIRDVVLVWSFSLACVVLLSSLILKQAFQPTEQMLERQKEFIASASHELKSPLSVLFVHIEKIKRCAAAAPECRRSVEVMGSECMRMSRLVNDLLLLASSDACFKQMVREEINVDTLLIRLYEKYETVCAENHTPLDMDLTGICFPAVVSDPELILQVLSVFVENAVSHSESRAPIGIQTSFSEKDITFCIVDHGKGISEKDGPFLFDRFYCADRSHTNRSHFGLGLSIAAELAAILCGKIGFYTTPGGGATFYLTIPIGPNGRK